MRPFIPLPVQPIIRLQEEALEHPLQIWRQLFINLYFGVVSAYNRTDTVTITEALFFIWKFFNPRKIYDGRPFVGAYSQFLGPAHQLPIYLPELSPVWRLLFLGLRKLSIVKVMRIFVNGRFHRVVFP